MRRAQPWKSNRARVLRSNATSAEDRLWSELRARGLNGLKFVRQYPIGLYVVDFACRELKIVVEVDGGTHGTQVEIANDGTRTSHLEARAASFAHNQDGVLDSLVAFIDAKSS